MKLDKAMLDAVWKELDEETTLEIGPGTTPGTSILDLSHNLRERVRNGQKFISMDNRKRNLMIPSLGSVSHMRMRQFITSNYLNDCVATMYIANVFSDLPGKPGNIKLARSRIQGLAKKLIPAKGQAIIIENYTPDYADALTKLPYNELGLDAEIIIGVDQYRAKMKELGISESGYARWSASKYSEAGHQ